MKSFAIDVDQLLSIAAAVVDQDGVLVEANAGFLRLLPDSGIPRVGKPVSRFFIQPPFASLVHASAAGTYKGLLTIGDYTGKTRTLLGVVRQVARGVHVLAEHDIVELERLGDAVLDLNHESAMAQRSLVSANVALRQSEGRILEASLTDALTGVGNRRKLEQALATEVSRDRRGQGPLSVIMADIDHFKRVNDTYGHAGGDKVLARFGAILRGQTRATDIVARFGGEEFVVLMPHTAIAQATAKADAIRQALAAELIDPLTSAVTSSFGVAELLPSDDGASLLARVDAALYQAKAGGRNQVMAAGANRNGRPATRHRVAAGREREIEEVRRQCLRAEDSRPVRRPVPAAPGTRRTQR